jgi:hypothetical protein
LVISLFSAQSHKQEDGKVNDDISFAKMEPFLGIVYYQQRVSDVAHNAQFIVL